MHRLFASQLLACLFAAACAPGTKTGGLDPVPVLSGVELTPKSATVQVGDSVAFSVLGRMSDSSTSSITVGWTATGGTVSAAGLWHAGASAGTYLVIATTQDAQFADTATITVSSTPVPVTLTSVVLTPARDTLLVGATRTFTVVGHYSNGTSGAVSVTWSATGGTVTSGGVYTAGNTAGTFRVVARANSDPLADTAQVVIRANPPAVTLTGVTVTPASVTLNPGATSQFTATARYSDGSTGTEPITWSATGGSVTTGGLYTAGALAGNFRLIGKVTSASFADTSAVAISDTTTPPPGGTVLLSETFENASLGARGWYDNASPAISTVEHHGGVGALEMAWASGAALPVKGGSMRHKFTPSDRVYVRYWVKYSANYVGSGKNYHPHEFHLVTDAETDDYIGPSTTHLTTYIEQNYLNGGRPQLGMTDVANIDVTKINVDLTNVTEQRASAGCNGSADGYFGDCYQLGSEWRNEKIWRAAQPSFLPNPGAGYKGDWNKVEVYFQLNSIVGGKGQADGIAQYWFNGQLIIDNHNVVFRTGAHPSMKFDMFICAPYIGDGSPVAQSFWVDDLVLATSKVP